MTIGLIGRKCGMTRIFQEDGASVPVTVVEVAPNRITQIKTVDHDGYSAIQIAVGEKRATRVNKPLLGHYAKAKVEPGHRLQEFRLNVDEMANQEQFKVGEALTLDLFEAGQFVDVQGVTKGKGFAGTIKRHHFSHQDYTHGNSLSHRVPGSIGQNQTPGRVFKGKKMAGQLGDVNRMAQNLVVTKIDKDRQIIFIRGSVPGAPNGDVVILPACKKRNKKRK